MILYAILDRRDGSGEVTEWFTERADAVRFLAKVEHDEPETAAGLTVVEVAFELSPN